MDRTIVDINTSYNRTINSLLNMLEMLSTTVQLKANVDRVKKRLSLLRMTNSDPYIVIKKGGPYLHKYGDKIMNRDETFFLTTDVRSKLDPSIEDIDFIIDLVQQIRCIYVTLDKSTKSKIQDDIIGLYRDYIGFCICAHIDP